MATPFSEPDAQPPSSSSEKKYISYGGEQVFRQPYSARDTQLYYFLLPILSDQRDSPQVLLDRVFNEPSRGQVDFRVAFPFVMLSFQHFGALGSKDLPDSAKGSFNYKEATLWLPVVDHKRPGLNFSYFVPYIFADNHYAIAPGREVYGYPKALAEVEMPLSQQDESHFRVTTEAIAHFSPEAFGEPLMLIEVQSADEPAPAPTLWQRWEHAAEHFTQHLFEDVADDTVEFVTKALFQPQVQMVFLKQFRDAANGEFACYQAIVEGAGSITDFQGGTMLGEFEVVITPLDSHPVCRELGIAERSRVRGFFMNFSFDILPGRETDLSS